MGEEWNSQLLGDPFSVMFQIDITDHILLIPENVCVMHVEGTERDLRFIASASDTGRRASDVMMNNACRQLQSLFMLFICFETARGRSPSMAVIVKYTHSTQT